MMPPHGNKGYGFYYLLGLTLLSYKVAALAN